MISRPLLGVVLAVALLTPVRSTRSEVIHGIVALRATEIAGWPGPGPMPWDDGFDFATRTVVPYTSAPSDLSFHEYYRGNAAWFVPHHGSGMVVVATPLAELDTAPVIADGYGASRPFDPAITYVMRTGEGQYVKFAARIPDGEWCCMTLLVEYYVQTDGSTNFGPLVPVRPTTWGQVKAFYR